MFGKILGYEIVKNKILINYESVKCIVTIVNEDVINFFVPLFREERNSKAVETSLESDVKFEVIREENSLTIKTDALDIKVCNNFKVNIYNSNPLSSAAHISKVQASKTIEPVCKILSFLSNFI